MRRALAVGLAAALLAACTKDTSRPPPPRDGRLGAQRCTGKPGPKNTVKPLLQRPFDGQFPVYNLFDHDLPLPGEIRAANVADKELTYCGIQALGLAEGYPGYAFGLPEGTPVLAAADGEVIAAGTVPAFACPLTMRLVDDQQAVDLRHDTLGGVGYLTRYVHLSSVAVKPGEKVVAGQRLGLSGRSGCALQPLLYFEVKRLTGTRTGSPTVVDPYGWDGPADDPWAKNERGAESAYLWKDGEAPTLRAK